MLGCNGVLESFRREHVVAGKLSLHPVLPFVEVLHRSEFSSRWLFLLLAVRTKDAAYASLSYVPEVVSRLKYNKP